MPLCREVTALRPVDSISVLRANQDLASAPVSGYASRLGITVLSHGRAGEILVEDARSDGTLVYLICKPWGAAGAQTGILVGPGEPPEEDKALQGTFPMFTATATAKHEPFRVTIDTTALPAGPNEFRSEIFIDAAERAASAGAGRVRINRDNAKEWGLIEHSESADA